MESTTTHCIEINNEDVDLEITWDTTPCYCESNYGDGTVTERWNESTALTAINITKGVDGETYQCSDNPKTSFAKAVAKALYEGTIYYHE